MNVVVVFDVVRIDILTIYHCAIQRMRANQMRHFHELRSVSDWAPRYKAWEVFKQYQKKTPVKIQMRSTNNWHGQIIRNSNDCNDSFPNSITNIFISNSPVMICSFLNAQENVAVAIVESLPFHRRVFGSISRDWGCFPLRSCRNDHSHHIRFPKSQEVDRYQKLPIGRES